MVLLPLLTFALFVFALVDIIIRPGDQVRHLPKLAWVFIVILLPLIGSILWFAVGREYQQSSSHRSTLRMPAARNRSPYSAPSTEAPYGGPSSTEAQLAALEREIEAAERDLRIRRLEEELRHRNDAGEPA
ncbi:PLD nuclease N-terminal domain-containing protein [Leifsonia sp. 2MCAF36]|uniref:PLD nuclease N-terminal domain-containing protein n=1 Tax=Leifsonia sp. 2MCAF36 TaxID=3232988 RepID=UPI003F9B991A